MSQSFPITLQEDSSSYTELNGQRTFKINLKYFLYPDGSSGNQQFKSRYGNNINVTAFAQFTSVDNVPLNVSQKGFQVNYGTGDRTINFDVSDNNFLNYDTVRVQVFILTQSGTSVSNTLGLQKNLVVENIGTVPNPVQISVGVSNNLAVINWNGEDNILQYHIVVKNNITNQTIREFNVSGSQTNTTVENLESSTNYSVYIIAINQTGNSEETSKAFTTLVTIIPPVVVPPVVVPPVVVPPVVVPKEYDVNTYRINEFGGVYNEIIYGIDGNRLLQLEAEFLVTLVGSPTPSDQEVKDFYNYIDVDTSVNTTMIEQRFLSFKIIDGRVQGKINFIATQFFNDYWKNKTLYSIIKITDSNGVPILLGTEPKQEQKVNELRFNQDTFEQISINEIVGDIPAVVITAYVWDKININTSPQAFSSVRTLDVVIDDPDGKTCPIGYHLGLNGKCVLDGGTDTGGATSIIGKVLGVTALLGTLALLGAKRR